MRRRGSASSCCSTLRAASLLDVGCGSGVLSIAAAKLGFEPVHAVDLDPQAIEATMRNAAANGVAVEARLADAADSALPATATAVVNVALDVDGRIVARLDCERVDHLRLPRSPSRRSCPAIAARTGARRRAGPPTCTCGRSKVRADGDVLGRLPRLQGLARRRPGGARAAACRRARGARRRRRRGAEHVLRHARGAPEVAACRLARRPHAPARVRHRLRRQPLGRRVRRPAGQRRRRGQAQRGDRRLRRRRRRCDRAASRPTLGSTASAPS